ncbi:ATP phosphoribosyltransferase regulatory subunit [Jannaschia rubra]|uniref:Histidine--tRNA ligase n=1 Tax=Jannaschia rubra TaxID=282197 RepID=A0A0M6XQT9_9RHOB|nr:ATP phosphoribosyltransferase regulatory subunit [Jannaschia rubra]CTQ33516.1 ATP phosphoribosyltransferase regulatory subunit [Jannaschia rubra]SFG03062.1 ATP phosphoribosyltransferase regulatory subunit [Jannaschia rubra]
MISAEDRARAADLLARFRAAGAQMVETPILQPAGALLDLYGEDIRARAFTTQDPLAGEMMLRPDFTVPVVQAHMENGAEPARYCYAGEVFRRQEVDEGRPREYLQVGYEAFDRDDPAGADAEVFDLLSQAVSAAAPVAATGDLGVLIAAVDALTTSDRRRAALRRHIWRPTRFRRLIDRFTGTTPTPATRATLLAQLADTPAETLIAAAGPAVGLRDRAEIAARLNALAEDAATEPITRTEADVIDSLLSLDTTMTLAIPPLRDMGVDLPGLGPAADRLEARAEALARRGHDPAALSFAPARGRTAMEYYDGFVFTLSAPGRPDLPPLATGGRYDALTAVLGRGRSIPAVGGVVRPGLLGRL